LKNEKIHSGFMGLDEMRFDRSFKLSIGRLGFLAGTLDLGILILHNNLMIDGGITAW